MFTAHAVHYVEVNPEKTPLLEPGPEATVYEFEKTSRWPRYIKMEMKIPKVQTIVGILISLLLLGMIVMFVAAGVIESHKPHPYFLDQPQKSQVEFPELLDFGENVLEVAWKEGEDLVTDQKNLEKMLFEKGLVPKNGTPSSLLQNFQRSNSGTDHLSNCAIIVEHVKRVLGECVDTNILPEYCKPDRLNDCNPAYKYRYFNGGCNNLRHRYWGMATTGFKRVFKPAYADGVSKPRISTFGDPLPNARFLSNELYRHQSRSRSNHTILMFYFGLFIDHDMIRIGSKTGYNGSAISCCDSQFLDNPSLLHPECMAITVPKNDPFYGTLGVKCLDFVRSAAVPGACPGQRNQMNLVSSLLDGSGVYSSSDEGIDAIRSYKNGLLKFGRINNTEMLPIARHISYECGFPKKDQFCFTAGDMRANELVGLTAIHAVWLREHNRLATRLHAINPHWDDNRLFQESRRIVGAELQHITYKEFLPILLGNDIVKEHGLAIDPEKGYDGYNPELDPTTHNVFGVAAFRVGQSLMRDVVDLVNPDYSINKKIPLHDSFLNPNIFYEKALDLLLRGFTSEKALSVESYITDEVRNRFFQPHNGHYGMDLSAISIQRGRDHGLPGYVEWRKFCGLPEMNSWDDLFNFMDYEHVQRLRKVYESVEDIDLIPAALSEKPLPGASVGPVHACLIARQFHDSRVGDRFWFEVQNQVGSFTSGQLEQIYKSSMARLFCDNSDQMESIQRWPLRFMSTDNPVLKCSEIPEVDLKAWTET